MGNGESQRQQLKLIFLDLSIKITITCNKNGMQCKWDPMFIPRRLPKRCASQLSLAFASGPRRVAWNRWICFFLLKMAIYSSLVSTQEFQSGTRAVVLAVLFGFQGIPGFRIQPPDVLLIVFLTRSNSRCDFNSEPVCVSSTKL